MTHRRSWIISSIFILTDAILLYSIINIAVPLREILTPLIGYPVLRQTVTPMAQLVIVLGIVTFLFQDLYPGYGLTAVKELERMSKSITLVFFLLTGVSYLNKPFQDFSRSIILIAWGLTLGILPVAHFILRNLLSRTRWYGVPVIIFGEGEWPKQIEKSLRRVRRLGWKVQVIFPIKEIERISKRQLPQIAILAPSTNAPTEDYARILSLHFRKVVLVRQRDNFGSLWIEPRDLDGQLGLEFHYHLLERHSEWLKRLIDFMGSLILVLFCSPLFVLLALIILMDSPGPVFFRQKRLAKNFKQFNVLKFRTMVQNAEQELNNLLQTNQDAKKEYDQYHKLGTDPRITRIGKWLRRFSLDEIPQLWNVLKGEMSLVGPRAYMPSELDAMGVYAQVILRVQPGITGWWQVTGRNQNTFQQRLQMDEHYISNWSLSMDVYILLKTFWVVLSGTGA